MAKLKFYGNLILLLFFLLSFNLKAQRRIPEKDPICKNPVKLLENVKNNHPRLLFGPEDIPYIKEKAKEGLGKNFWDMLLSYLPVCKPPTHRNFLKSGTDAQRQGLWRLPTVSLHYLLTGDKKSYEKAVGFLKLFMELPEWETGKERNSGMGAASIMVGVALTYDWLYNSLPTDFREKLRKKILYHARAMYYGGHLNYNHAVGYWQNDPLNNHRWFRNASLFLSTLAIYEGREEEKWIMKKALEEIELVHKYLPEDGSSHEGVGYMIFGGPMLLMPYIASDRCLGTNFLASSFFKNIGYFRMHTLTPGLNNSFLFGDGGGFGGYHAFLWKPVSYHKEKDVQDGLEKLFFIKEKKPFDFGWWNLLWYDPKNSGGNYKNIPKTAYFKNIGLVIVREGWDKNDTAVMFKCGPLGGYSLNKFRNEHNYCYVNVAHDDPDANSFTLFTKEKMVAETDRYSSSKKSKNYNTIIVDGEGQVVPGRKEGMVWSQPAVGNVDMTTLAYITKFKDSGDIVIVEGECGRSYRHLRKFRRTLVWIKRKYILILDEIISKGKSNITWLIQGPELVEIEKPKENKIFYYQLKNGDIHCNFKVYSEKEGFPEIKTSPADNHGKILGWKQLNLKFADVENMRIASIYTPWDENIDMVFLPENPKVARISIQGKNFKDEWVWETSEGLKEPSLLKGKVDGKEVTF